MLITCHAGAARSMPPLSRGIVILDSPEASALARQCVTRLRQELTAGGFDVSTWDPGPRRDAGSTEELMAQQAEALAVIALVGEPGEPQAELWILDRVGTAPETRRLPVPTDDAEHTSEVLAIRTMEVLKASALKRLIDSTKPQPLPLPTDANANANAAADHAAASPVASLPRFGLEAGISVLENIGGPGPAAVPLVRARARLGDAFFIRLTLAGLGSQGRVDASTRSASALVSQSFGLMELGAALLPGRRWRPGLSMGVGALRDESKGEGLWPYQGLEQARWALALDAGLGLLVQIGSNLSLAAEAHALVAIPHSTVRFSTVEEARLGFPALLGSLTMVAWL